MVLDQQSIDARFKFAQSVILEAGTIANEYFGRISSLNIKSKGLHDLVSEADVNTERFISESFAKQFPEDSFLGEESGARPIAAGQGVWVVDPIDGTQPFLNGIPSWCISIAFVIDNKNQFGLVYDATRNELFAGGLTYKATLNGKEIKPHAGLDFSAGMVSVGFAARTSQEFLFSATKELLAMKGMFYRNGSGALSLAYVACGRLMGHVEPHMHPWDCLGAMAIIQAAGGRINDYLTENALQKGNRVVCATPAIYEKLEAFLNGLQ